VTDRRRLDCLLTERGLAPSRQQACRAVREGRVKVDGRTAHKPATRVPTDANIEVATPEETFVSYGGHKLSAALAAFGVRVRGRVCLDVGAGTGGFTDCLLRSGADRVFAVDVGSGQLDPVLRSDPRVEVREGVNARLLAPNDFEPRPDLAVVDVSFISLQLVLPALSAVLGGDGRVDVIALVKPQFEAGRAEVRKGFVRSTATHCRVLERVVEAAHKLGFAAESVIVSPRRDPRSNREFLLHLRRPGVHRLDRRAIMHAVITGSRATDEGGRRRRWSPGPRIPGAFGEGRNEGGGR